MPKLLLKNHDFDRKCNNLRNGFAVIDINSKIAKLEKKICKTFIDHIFSTIGQTTTLRLDDKTVASIRTEYSEVKDENFVIVGFDPNNGYHMIGHECLINGVAMIELICPVPV